MKPTLGTAMHITQVIFHDDQGGNLASIQIFIVDESGAPSDYSRAATTLREATHQIHEFARENGIE